MLSEFRDQEGIPSGNNILWHDNGQKMIECTFLNGKRDGVFQQWYPNGQIRSKCTYDNGILVGIFTIWYENGQKWAERFYSDVKPERNWKSWDMEGNPADEEVDAKATEDFWSSSEIDDIDPIRISEKMAEEDDRYKN